MIFAIAQSLSATSPSDSALAFLPSSKTTVNSLPTPPVTWAAVRISPSGETTTPLPEPSPRSMQTVARRLAGSASVRCFWITSRSCRFSGTFLSLT